MNFSCSENGQKVRTDCLVVESNIHHPNNSSLLGDCVLTRPMRRAEETFDVSFENRRLRAKRRVMAISNAGKDLYGKAPKQVSFDGGFATRSKSLSHQGR
jgi:hypothetical protein